MKTANITGDPEKVLYPILYYAFGWIEDGPGPLVPRRSKHYDNYAEAVKDFD